MIRGDWLQRTRTLQVAFLVLLATCAAQLTWWMYDEVRYTAQVQAERLEETRLSGQPVTPAVVQRLREQRFHRLNRYAWEGAFFMVVLVGAMAVVYRAVRAATALQRRQELFLAGISHELKSPLAGIRLSAETLALRDPPAGRRAELVGRVLDDVRRLERTIGNVLETAKLASRRVPRTRARIPLAQAAESALHELRAQAADAGVAMTAVVPEELAIVADPDAVQTILRNLLHNAVKASGGGHVAMRGFARDGQAFIQVMDNGIGFPPQEARRLFDKFYRVERGADHALTGTGLGLFLVRRSVQDDGGSVQAESAGPGLGATFTVSWPAASPA